MGSVKRLGYVVNCFLQRDNESQKYGELIYEALDN